MGYPLQCSWGFPGGSVCKESGCNAGALGSIQGWEDTLEELGSPLQYSCLENPHGQVAGCSPWGRKESDTTE